MPSSDLLGMMVERPGMDGYLERIMNRETESWWVESSIDAHN